MSTYILETDRLLLRTWDEGDVVPMFEINLDPRVHEFLIVGSDLEWQRAMIKRFQDSFYDKGYTYYAVELKATGEFIGYVGVLDVPFEEHFTPAVEIGWRLASAHWNQGYATEAAKAVLEMGFVKFGMSEIVSFTYVGNLRSMRVMEKIGMKRDVKGDFYHPRLDKDHPLALTALYRLTEFEYLRGR